MSSLIFVFLIVLFTDDGVLVRGGNSEINFDQNYKVIWGDNHAVSLNQGTEIQLLMDNSSGAGIGSKMDYGSGFFHLRIKVPGNDSAGVVTAYYMSSQGSSSRHDELDFELLGNREEKPYILQTNVFADDGGNREQKLKLWFDPRQDFHDYQILWNQHHIVFFVDNIPIRVFKNMSNIGVSYPTKPMQIHASLWDGDSWATDGGRTKINWSSAPFKAYFQGFDVKGCEVLQNSSDIQHCDSDKYQWNTPSFWQLDPVRQRQYEDVKTRYMIYDYCTDRKRNPTPPLECQH
ncbi:xyloglucan endotransglucosylase/hydrolase protein 2-like [Arachis ipaensis]|uniref:Xyloglucan endotransglucosylase/hydrolase n=3 Tax=Arachis hypogaea TaxID=3818 RepID=A0A444XFT3_ARAHY|nr:xyloglucan endotransglucosylase/hydrolase protein 2-like [Arachis ipaensis]XP_025678148.1 xyloglucan endotransglucosylase/hydrolase protein 2-like [Arachis hypogaea]RYQ88631.1 hypothetical protein Ahy_B09g095711 isoform A [Arachis hypogaea]